MKTTHEFRPDSLVGMQNALTQTDEWAQKGNCYAHFSGLPRTLRQETIGIIGIGELGTLVASHFNSLGSKVLLAERPSSTSIREGRTSFQDTLSKSTVLVVTTSLTPETRNLISDSELALLPSDAIVINVARGEIVSEKALVTALKEKRIAGAAVDVFTPEPAGKETSLLVREAEGLDGKLLVSPHVAWYAIASVEKLRRVTAANIEEWVRGEKGNNFVC
jgi:phosphoglycerate dehydrogenase-like enzyme